MSAIDSRITDPGKRYDFLLLFDVQDGNPNGDPDAGNLPRIDPETMQGIVTDVCLKRKIRNYVDLVHGSDYDALDTNSGNGIFVRDSGVALNTKIKAAAESAGEKPEKKKTLEKGRAEMCRRYYDVRMFGGVLSTGDYNCGQVRGPMQLTFSRSVDPIVPGDVAITRVAITKEGEQKETEIGRKSQVPYGLYVGKGFFSPMLAGPWKRNDKQEVVGGGTNVSKEDMELFWTAVRDMFEHDHSAARGDMRLRQVFIFRHDNPLGNAASGSLFDRVTAEKKPTVEAPRKFADYVVALNEAEMPAGVTAIRLLD